MDVWSCVAATISLARAETITRELLRWKYLIKSRRGIKHDNDYVSKVYGRCSLGGWVIAAAAV